MIVHTSIGGHRVRVQLSNAFGTSALQVGAAHLALHDKDSAIVVGSDHALTFSGRASAAIPPGAELLSDRLDFDVPTLGDLVISLYVPVEAPAPTIHLTGLHTTYVSQPGDFTAAPAITDASAKPQLWYWISAVDVVAPSKAGLIVAFGDSITDGVTSTPDTDRSWPSKLAQRLAANKATANIAIVNGFMCAPTDEEAIEAASGWTLFIFALSYYGRNGIDAPGAGNLWREYQDWRQTDKAKQALRNGLIGSPETIRRRLRQFEDAHVDQVILLNQAGRTSHQAICDSLDLFAREVMPEFHARQPVQEAWKADVLAGRIVLEELETETYDVYAHQNEDIVRLTAEQLKQRMADKEKAAQGA